MQWLTECLISRGERIPDRRSSIMKMSGFPNVLVLTCGIRIVLESERERSCLDGEYILYMAGVQCYGW